MTERAIAHVDLGAVERNCAQLRSLLSEGTRLCAVVKADAYGHGHAWCAKAALSGGADWLAVATAGEAAELRRHGVDSRILVMGALTHEEARVALEAVADVVVWDERFARALAELHTPGTLPANVHVKLDTGMGRLGTRVLDEALEVAERVAAAGPAVELAGAMTHFASADEDPEFTAAQLSRFEPFVRALRGRWPEIVIHAANSAATLREPASHFDLVRCGIAVYGADPMNVDPLPHGLEPALELSSYVAAVKRASPGESAGYGRRWVARSETWLATVPLGYGDGIRRALSNNCEVLIGGRRYPVVGTVSMDNITVEVGNADSVRCGDRVILIGADGGERVTAEEIARRIDTIYYEIFCGLSARVRRVYHRDGAPA
jgi:alanine racemase